MDAHPNDDTKRNDALEDILLDLMNAGLIEIAGRTETGEVFFRIRDVERAIALMQSDMSS